jgi:hypothetical protein
MNSLQATEPPSRRKWGWFFLAALLVELFAFILVADRWHRLIELRRDNLKFKDVATFQFIEMQQLQKQLNEIYVVAGIGFIATLAFAVRGFRRYER